MLSDCSFLQSFYLPCLVNRRMGATYKVVAVPFAKPSPIGILIGAIFSCKNRMLKPVSSKSSSIAMNRLVRTLIFVKYMISTKNFVNVNTFTKLIKNMICRNNSAYRLVFFCVFITRTKLFQFIPTLIFAVLLRCGFIL